jgi:hypothetical protein
MANSFRDDLLAVNCGRCGKPLLVRLEDVKDMWVDRLQPVGRKYSTGNPLLTGLADGRLSVTPSRAWRSVIQVPRRTRGASPPVQYCGV